MSTHSFHPRSPIKTTWWEGETGACASLEFEDCRIDLFARGEDMRDRMQRAILAFSVEMQREPIEHQEAAE